MRERERERERESFPGLLKQLTAPPLISALDPPSRQSAPDSRRFKKFPNKSNPPTVISGNFQRPDDSSIERL